MAASVLAQSQACITTLRTIDSALSDSNRQKGRIHHERVNDELERFSLWIGNIGAMHLPESPMSLESRLCDATDILTHVLDLLDDLNEVTGELWEIVSGQREGEIASMPHNNANEEDQDEETELLEETGACITRLFRVSSLIRQAAPTDLFAKALSRNRYRFNDQYDIAHVGEKYPKLATKESAWLQKRLGQAITQRRHYLSYIQDHREKLEGMLTPKDTPELVTPKTQAPIKQLPAKNLRPDSFSRPSTFFTKASTLAPGQITPQILNAKEESDSEDDARSYTTISRSVAGDLDSSATIKVPKLDELQVGSKKEVECPFCFRIKKFRNDRVWRRHVFFDLRSYVCTFPDCDAPYFGDINEWFRHEMQSHRSSYTCQFCKSKTFQDGKRYLDHVREKHPNILEDSEEQIILDIAQKPLNQICAQECPCCSEWVDRLKERAEVASMPSDASEHILYVHPTVFKRHLASHLEQLALFAIPNGSAEDDVNSNAAIEEDVRALSRGSGPSTLAFDSPRQSSLASEGQSSNEVLITEEVVEAAAGNDVNEREETTLRRGADIPIMEEAVDAAGRDLGGAIRIARKLLEVTTDDHPDLAERLNNLGLLLDDQGDREEAVAIYREALHAGQKTLRSNDLFTLDIMDNLASTLRGQGQLTEAEQIYEQVLRGREKALGSTHMSTLDTVHDLSALYAEQDKYEESEAMYRRALEGYKKVLRPEHPNTLTSVSQLGLVLLRQGKYDEAELMYRRALAGYEKVLGLEHPDTLTSVSQLGLVLSRQGKYDEAALMNQRAVEGREKVLGLEHPDTLTSVSQLGLVLSMQGKYDEAELINQQALEGREKVLGPEHPDTLVSVNQLGWMLLKQGKYNKAKWINQQALEGRKKVFGLEHPCTLASMVNLASALRSQGWLEEAEELGVQAVETRKRVLGEEHPDTLISIANLAATYHYQGQWKEAEELVVQVLETRKRVLGEWHPHTLASMAILALTLKSQSRNKEAISLMRECVTLRRRIFSPQHSTRVSSLKILNAWEKANPDI